MTHISDTSISTSISPQPDFSADAAEAHTDPTPAFPPASRPAARSAILERLPASPTRRSISEAPESDSPPQSTTALARQLDAMWLGNADPASSRHADDAGSESSDDWEVRVETDPPKQRTDRKRKLEEYVDAAADRTDAANLGGLADALRRQAIATYPMTLADRIGETLSRSQPTLAEDRARQIVDAMFVCEDGQLAWDLAAEHYHAAVGTSRKLALPVATFSTLDAMGAQCSAQAERFSIAAQLLRAISRSCASEIQIMSGHVPCLERLLEPLRDALARCGSEKLRALPLHQAPIAAFDEELDKMFSRVRKLAHDVQQGNPVVTIPNVVPPHEHEAWCARRASSITELMAIADKLWPALRGMPAVPLPGQQAPAMAHEQWQPLQHPFAPHDRALAPRPSGRERASPIAMEQKAVSRHERGQQSRGRGASRGSALAFRGSRSEPAPHAYAQKQPLELRQRRGELFRDHSASGSGAPAAEASPSEPTVRIYTKKQRPDSGQSHGQTSRDHDAPGSGAPAADDSRSEPTLPVATEKWPVLGQEHGHAAPGQGASGWRALALDASPAEPTPPAVTEKWPALGQELGPASRGRGAWAAGAPALRPSLAEPERSSNAPGRPTQSSNREKSAWGRGAPGSSRSVASVAMPTPMAAHQQPRVGSQTGAQSSTSLGGNERGRQARPFNGTDTRSNTEVIAEYQAGRRSADAVLAITTSQLRAPGGFEKSMKMFRAVMAAGIRPNVILYNAAISTCGDAGRADQAIALLTELKRLALQDPEMCPTLITYSSVISACGKEGRADQALGLLAELKGLARQDSTMRPDGMLFSAVIAACGKAGRANEALRLLKEMKDLALQDRRMRPDVRTYNSAITACANAGRPDQALALLTELKHLAQREPAMRPDVRTYTAAITACAKAGRADDALALLAQMKALAKRDPSMRPDKFVFTAAITACDRGGRPDKARVLRQELDSLGGKDPAINRRMYAGA